MARYRKERQHLLKNYLKDGVFALGASLRNDLSVEVNPLSVLIIKKITQIYLDQTTSSASPRIFGSTNIP
jgi:hypothetical protein